MASQFEAAKFGRSTYQQPSGGMDLTSLVSLLNGSGKGKSGGKGKDDDRPSALRFFPDKMFDSRKSRHQTEFWKDPSVEAVCVVTPFKGMQKFLSQERAVCMWLLASDDIDDSIAFAYDLQLVLTAKLDSWQKQKLLQTIRDEMISMGVDTQNGIEGRFSRINKQDNKVEAQLEYILKQMRMGDDDRAAPDRAAPEQHGRDSVHLPDEDIRSLITAAVQQIRGSDDVQRGSFIEGGSSGSGLRREVDAPMPSAPTAPTAPVLPTAPLQPTTAVPQSLGPRLERVASHSAVLESKGTSSSRMPATRMPLIPLQHPPQPAGTDDRPVVAEGDAVDRTSTPPPVRGSVRAAEAGSVNPREKQKPRSDA